MPLADDLANAASGSPTGDLVFAVDTGGTKTAAWLVELTGADSYRLVGNARTSAGNPLSVGFENAATAIQEAFTISRKAIRSDHVRPASAVLSIAGAANRDMTERFIAWARSIGLADRVAIVSDVLPILAAGTPDCCGVALIAGTGSSAFGRAQDGTSKRCGGWGFLLGDEGSGFAIGRAALHLALESLEEGLPPVGLAGELRTMFSADAVPELTRAIYGAANPRHAIADLAKLVVKLADAGDTESMAILDGAAIELADLAARTAYAVGIQKAGLPLAASGGVLANSVWLQQQLRTELAKFDFNCELNVVREPLAGCVRLAEPQFEHLLTWHPIAS
jgi:glucosamine kinase